MSGALSDQPNCDRIDSRDPLHDNCYNDVDDVGERDVGEHPADDEARSSHFAEV